MGTGILHFIDGEPVFADLTYFGVWTDPGDASLIAPSYVSTLPPRWAGNAFTVGGYAAQVSAMTIDLGNQIYVRPLPSTTAGLSSAMIQKRLITGSFDPEATLVANSSWNPYTIFTARTEQALVCSAGASPNLISIAAPKLQFTDPKEGDRNGVQVDNIAFQLNQSAANTPDEFTITVQS